MVMLQKLLAISIFLFVSIFPSPAYADEGWVIDRFHSDIALQNSGEVRIVETIEVDFNTLNKHGIYRDIPYEYTREGKTTYTEIKVQGIVQDKSRAKYQVSRQNGYIRMKIGDADKTISGKHIYTLTYTAKGVLRGFADHDELYWNVTGNYWPVPITKADATVTLDRPGLRQIACYEGFVGSPTTCTGTQTSSQLAQFTSTRPLPASEGMTIAVGYEKGLFPLLTVERPKSLWEQFIEWPSLTTLLAVLGAGVVTVFYRWHKYGRDYWFGQNIFGKKNEQGVLKPIGGHETITVEFTSPEKLRPAEIGVLMDERADTTDVVATIIDLATRGYITITEVPKKWLFGQVDYELKKLTKEQSGLVSYEKTLLRNLFKTGDQVKLSDLKQTFYDELQEVKKELYQEVVSKKLFPSDPEKVRSNNIIIGLVLVIAGGVLFGWSMSAEIVLLADIALGVVFSGILFFIMSGFMPRRTAYGRELYRRIKGYRLFISTAEKHRQKFFEKRNMFNEVLPYAIVFGLTAKFAKQMHDMGIQPSNTGWYYGAHPFNTATFGSNMNDFSKSLSTAMASTPSSSGGFSGGSSGGGFGGGGGGSW